MDHDNSTQDLKNYNHQKQSYQQKFSWTLQQTNYELLDDKVIHNEYKKLRQQIFNLNDIVVTELEKVQRKIDKKRAVSVVSPARTNQIAEKQIQNNLFILSRMKKQYKTLKHKPGNMKSKQTLQQQIQQTKQKIHIVKKQINMLKLKNKNIGDDIINTDLILEELREIQKQLQQWIRKKQNIQKKVDKVKCQTQEINNNTKKIQNSSNLVNNFIKTESQTKQLNFQNKKIQQLHSQKSYILSVNKKNYQTYQHTKQFKYQQLLQQLAQIIQKNKLIEQKIIINDQKKDQTHNQIKKLQIEFKDIKKQLKDVNEFFNINNQQVIQQNSIKKDKSIEIQKPIMIKRKTFGVLKSQKQAIQKFNIKQNLIDSQNNTIDEDKLSQKINLKMKKLNFSNITSTNQSDKSLIHSQIGIIKSSRNKIINNIDCTYNQDKNLHNVMIDEKIQKSQSKFNQKNHVTIFNTKKNVQMTAKQQKLKSNETDKKIKQNYSQNKQIATEIEQKRQKDPVVLQNQKQKVQTVIQNQQNQQNIPIQKFHIDLERIESNIDKIQKKQLKQK